MVTNIPNTINNDNTNNNNDTNNNNTNNNIDTNNTNTESLLTVRWLVLSIYRSGSPGALQQ